ncbi:MAG: hypothetical protein JW820_15535 [Spirochaetales bacterium]|nr:hypothetical protein [Spirochaetales bacterium]
MHVWSQSLTPSSDKPVPSASTSPSTNLPVPSASTSPGGTPAVLPSSSQLPALTGAAGRRRPETVVAREVRRCAYCGGKGRQREMHEGIMGWRVCLGCFGKGEVEILLGPGEVLIVCHYCAGNGFEVPYEHRRCRMCEGVGSVIYDPARFPEFGGKVPWVQTWGEKNDPLIPHPLYSKRVRRRRPRVS